MRGQQPAHHWCRQTKLALLRKFGIFPKIIFLKNHLLGLKYCVSGSRLQSNQQRIYVEMPTRVKHTLVVAEFQRY